MEIKIKCPQCDKEIKVALHIVEKLKAENEYLKLRLQKIENEKNKVKNDMPDFFKEIFK